MSLLEAFPIKKKVQYATISCSLEKTTIWWKMRDKVDVCRHPCRDSHHQNKTGEVFLFCVQFSSVQFSSFLFKQNIIQYRNTYRNCKSLFKSFFGVKEDWGLAWGAREVSWEGKKTPRAPQPNPQSSITPRKHLHSDWVRVCRRLMKPRLPSPKKNI